MAAKTPDSPVLQHAEQQTLNSLEQRSSEIIDQFGLKTPNEIDRFIKSPEGKSILEEIRSELVMEHLVKEEQHALAMAQELMEKQLSAMFEYLDMEKKEHLAKQQYDLIEQQLHDAQLNEHKPAEPTADHPNYELDNALKAYEDRINEITAEHHALKQEESALTTKQADLEAEERSVREQYALHDEYTHDDSFDFLMHEDELLHDELINHKESLNLEIDDLFKKITQDLERGANSKPLIHKQNALHQRRDKLDELLAVHQQEKAYCDETGNASNAKNASFAVPKNKKIVYEQGEYFLLNADQDWQTLKNSPEARAEAKKSFQNEHLNLMTVKARLRHNERRELSDCKERLSNNTSAIARVALEKRLCENKMRELQAAQALVQKQLQTERNNNAQNNPNAPQATPRPTPRPSIGSSMSKSVPTNKPQQTASYQRLNQMKHQDNRSNKDINKLLSQIPPGNADAIRQYINSLLKHPNQLSAMPAGLRDRMLLQLAVYGVQSSRPEQTREQIASPINNQYKATLPDNNASLNEDKKSDYESPSPFNTTPSPYKK